MKKTAINKSLNISKFSFYTIALIFFAYNISSNEKFLIEVIMQCHLEYLGLSILLYSLSHFLAPLCCLSISKMSLHQLKYKDYLDAQIINLPGKFIPGGIWHTTGRISYFLRKGLTLKWTITLVTLENIFSVVIGLTLAFVFFIPSSSELEIYKIKLIAIVFIAITTAILITLRFRSKDISSSWKINTRKIFETTLIYVFSWIILGLSFSFFVLSLFKENSLDTIYILATYFTSWAAGYIAIFAPQGIGVFEATAASLLHLPQNFSETIGALFIYRLMMAITDLTLWSVRIALAKCITTRHKISPAPSSLQRK